MMANNDPINKHGQIEQLQKGFFAVRIRTIAGNLSSEQLRKVAELTDKYGRGQLHITTRQSLEIHWVQELRLADLFREIQDAGLLLAVRGARMLSVIACPGRTLCQRGISDTIMLTNRLNEGMVGNELPGKTKIAVSGCPSSCAKPQINDIGLHGVSIPAVNGGCVGCGVCAQSCKVKAAQIHNGRLSINGSKCVGCGVCVKKCPHQVLSSERQGYAIYVGGKIGRVPMLGTKLFASIPEEEAVFYIETILDVYQQLSLEGERIGTVIKRIGLDTFREELFKKASSQSCVCADIVDRPEPVLQ